MQNNYTLTGSIVALITPMSNNNQVDYKALKSLVEFHIENGTSAIVSVGTTGESATLDNSEHLTVIKKTIEFAKSRIPIIAGTGANSTTEAIMLTKSAQSAGADYALLVTPYYNRPTQEGLYQHYKAVANASSIAQILYNVPSRTAVDLEVETVARLAKIDNIIAIKDATGDLNVARKLIEKCPKDFLFYSGDDKTAIDFIALGGNGGISVSANVVPDKVAKAYELAINKDLTGAKIIDDEISCLHDDLFIEPNPIPVKWALHLMGKCEADIRLPLTELSMKYKDIINKDLTKLALL